MQTHITFGKKQFLLELKNASVIHADKYSEARGGWGNLPVWSTLYTDLVMNSSDDGISWQTTIRNRNLPVYQGQNVSVLLLEQQVIGFIDQGTNKYYYTRTDFNSFLPIGWPLKHFWITGLFFLLIAIVNCFMGKNYNPDFVVIPFFGIAATLLVYHLQKWIVNKRFMRAVDHYLQDS